MFDNSLGSEIMRLRKEKNLTQKELAEEICTQATISMIEKGAIKPGLDILYLISLKLDKPISYFANIMLNEDYPLINSIVQELESLTISHNYQLIYSIIKRELSFKPKDKWYEIFLHWHYFLSAYYLNFISIDIAIERLTNLLNNEHNSILKKDFLYDRICNSIAILYSTNKNYEKALSFYNKINLNINDTMSPRLNHQVYKLRIIYNKAKTLYDMNSLEESKKQIELGIKCSINLENMSFLGSFYYYLGLIQEKLNDKSEDISHSFNKAYFFFNILDRKMYKEIMEKEHRVFLNFD
ncbi:helix-turn-helix domain-containing protein [Rummeliibacillus pycnus]|uniref:helix-turn-helix domain-containing protein n=1 Tax=Rummeliibacillus pycnus TaxID=101070 RepID=UPI0014727547|nr:helix-turn-helix domain-containing protein [Rummeliibacillus pycnus]